MINNNNSLNEVTYRKIRDDIMNLTLEPGTDMSVQKLSTQYGVSRTPVREAFVRLQRVGLVEIYPQRKTVVSKINLKRVKQEWFMRMTLEAAVVDSFVENSSMLIVDAMYELIHKQKSFMDKEYYREFYRADNRFHELIFRTAGQELSWETIDDVSSHYNRMRLLSNKINGIGQRIIDEHEMLVQAVRNKDIQAMKEIITMHLSNIDTVTKKLAETCPQYFTGVTKNKQVEKEDKSVNF